MKQKTAFYSSTRYLFRQKVSQYMRYHFDILALWHLAVRPKNVYTKFLFSHIKKSMAVVVDKAALRLFCISYPLFVEFSEYFRRPPAGGRRRHIVFGVACLCGVARSIFIRRGRIIIFLLCIGTYLRIFWNGTRDANFMNHIVIEHEGIFLNPHAK